MYHTHLPLSAGSVRCSRPRPADPSRAGGEGEDGSDPPFFAAGAARRVGGVPRRVPTPCPTRPPSPSGVAPVRIILASLQEGSDARQRARADAPTSGAMTRRGGGFLMTVGSMSWWCEWHWPPVFPVDDPVTVLLHCHTPNLYRAVVAWQCVAPAAGVSIAGSAKDQA